MRVYCRLMFIFCLSITTIILPIPNNQATLHDVHKIIQKERNIQNDDTFITIFIHGSTKPNLKFGTLIKLFRDNVENSAYMYTCRKTRKNKFFFQSHAMQEIGLKEINIDKKDVSTAAWALSYLNNTMYKLHRNPHKINNYTKKHLKNITVKTFSPKLESLLTAMVQT